MSDADLKGALGSLARTLAKGAPPPPTPIRLPSAMPGIAPATAATGLVGLEEPPAPRAPRDSVRAAMFPPLHAWPARHRGDDAAIRFEGGVTTFAGLDTRARDLSAALRARGVRPGHVVGFLGHNHPAMIAALLALSRIGAALLPLNSRLAPEEWSFILRDAGVRLLLAPPSHRAEALALAPEGVDRDAFAMDPTEPLPPGQASHVTGDPSDPLLVVYTSGSTGRPKGAVLDGAAVAATARNAVAIFGMTEEDHVLTVLPLFHVGGLNIQTVPALSVGATVTLHARFDAGAWFDAVERERPTLSLLVPAVMRALVTHPRWATAELSSLRAVGAGSSDLPAGLVQAFLARGVPVQNVFGATETGPIAIAQDAAEARAHPGSLGRPAPLTEARVQDAAGHPLPTDAEGEIAVRGPNVMLGYLNGAGGEGLTDGWFRTGDTGRVDADGRFHFVGRSGAVIISGGENIYPAELERVLATAPGILEGAVCGVPNPRWGEVPVAVVVAGPGYDAEAVLRHFEGRIARFKQPHHVVTVTAVPRTALGKVDGPALKALALS